MTMPSDHVSAALHDNRPSRRRVLATLGAVASVSTAGCSSSVLPGGGSDGADGSSEVAVENGTSSNAEIAVRVIDEADETLFSRVFALASDTMVSRGALETIPSRVHAFTADGASQTWQYDPDLPVEFDCEPKDIGLTLHQDNTIEPWYDC